MNLKESIVKYVENIMGKDLKTIRNEIDLIDIEIQNLIQNRAKLAMSVAEIKLKDNKDATFYKPEREAQIISKILNRNKGPLKDKNLGYIFKEIWKFSQ